MIIVRDFVACGDHYFPNNSIMNDIPSFVQFSFFFFYPTIITIIIIFMPPTILLSTIYYSTIHSCMLLSLSHERSGDTRFWLQFLQSEQEIQNQSQVCISKYLKPNRT